MEGRKVWCSPDCKATFTFFSRFVLGKTLGLCLYVLDILTDVNVAMTDYKAGDTIYAYITIGLVFAPGTLLSCYLFCEYFARYVGEIACLKAPFWIMASPFMPVWVVLRDLKQIFDAIVATFLTAKRDVLKEKLSKPSKAYLLKYLEAFVEAAPQLLVRLFRVASRSPMQFSDLRRSEVIQISFSLLSLSSSVVSTHQKSVSTQQVMDGSAEIHTHYSLPWYLQLVATGWWLCFLISRFEALALFSASYGSWILLIVGAHVILMFVFQTMSDHKNNLQRLFIYIFGAFVFIFAYVQFNLKTRLKVAVWFPYTVFAIVLFVENSIMLTMWFFNQQNNLDTIFPQSLDNATQTPLNATMFYDTDDVQVEDLVSHWKVLLYVHYGVYGLGLLLMIFVFWGAAVCSEDDVVKPVQKVQESRSNYELKDLMTS